VDPVRSTLNVGGVALPHNAFQIQWLLHVLHSHLTNVVPILPVKMVQNVSVALVCVQTTLKERTVVFYLTVLEIQLILLSLLWLFLTFVAFAKEMEQVVLVVTEFLTEI